ARRGTWSAVRRTWWASWRREERGSKRSAWISKRRVVTALTSDVDTLPEDRDRPRHLDRAHLRQGRRHRRERTVPRGRQSRQNANPRRREPGVRDGGARSRIDPGGATDARRRDRGFRRDRGHAATPHR